MESGPPHLQVPHGRGNYSSREGWQCPFQILKHLMEHSVEEAMGRFPAKPKDQVWGSCVPDPPIPASGFSLFLLRAPRAFFVEPPPSPAIPAVQGAWQALISRTRHTQYASATCLLTVYSWSRFLLQSRDVVIGSEEAGEKDLTY